MVMRFLNVTGCSDHPEPGSQASGASWPDVSVHPEPKSQAMGASWPDVGEFMKDECDDQCEDEHLGLKYTINREAQKDLGAAIAKPLVCKLRSTLSSSDEEQHPHQSKQQSDATILAEAMFATPLAAKHQALTKNVKAAALRLKEGPEPKAKALEGPRQKQHPGRAL